ncbi:hypothetical protein FIBSPDRAFT_946085 [Athelia psychrophila]|uniref:Uncharacterized protein n=1 Tax=Athelia psychrophila TaxID=1759441 RepID=A0A166T8Z3_9AGAM|nr:hypothetical protein FIBSPDRAFT_946085 [Fibularhizoctonia sp. CBS 109695]
MDEVPSDPATQFRRRARITLSSHSSSPSPTQHDPLALTSGDGDDRDENDAKLRHSGNSDNSSAQYRSSLSYGQAVKRAKHGMSTKSTADFDSFLKASTLGEHVTLLMATTLEVRDMLAAREVVAVEWKIPAQLKANIKLYSLAFLLSPLIKSYRGKAAESVLDVMRELHITELPPTKETGQITESLKLDSATRNIAALTNTVIGKSRVKATLQLYICLAFIRFHVVNYPDIEDEHFWVRVDQTLEEWRKDTTEVELNQTHNDMYLADKELYGDLSASEFRVTDISSIEGWQHSNDFYFGLNLGGAPAASAREGEQEQEEKVEEEKVEAEEDDEDEDEDEEDDAQDDEDTSSADKMNIGPGQAFAAASKTEPDPLSFAEAMAPPFSEQWAEAMRSEYASLLGKEVFEHINTLKRNQEARELPVAPRTIYYYILECVLSRPARSPTGLAPALVLAPRVMNNTPAPTSMSTAPSNP